MKDINLTAIHGFKNFFRFKKNFERFFNCALINFLIWKYKL